MPPQTTYRMSLLKEEKSNFGELLHLLLLKICDNSLKNMDDEFLKSNCTNM
jgi:hypothetical protein